MSHCARPENSAVLVMGILPRVIVPIARVLRIHGIDVHAASVMQCRPIRSKALHSFTIVASDSESFRHDLFSLIEHLKIGVIIPCGDEVLHALTPLYDELKERVFLCCQEPAIYKQVLSKEITLGIAHKLGIPVPHTYEIADVEDLLSRGATIRFPLIAKPRSKEFERNTGIRFQRFESFNELKAVFDVYPKFGQWFLIQEFLPGVGVGVEVLMHGGEPLVVFQHRRVRELPVGGGVSVAADSEPVDPVLSRYAFDLLRALRWEGVAMVEFRQDRQSGRLALMEVNGRFWGSMALSVHAGIEFPYYAVQLAQGMAPSSLDRPYQIGVRFRWLLGDINRMVEIALLLLRRRITLGAAMSEAVAFFRDFFPPGRDALWSWADPRPALDELGQAARLLAALAVSGTAKLLLPKSLINRLKKARPIGRKRALTYLWLSYFGSRRSELTRLPASIRSIVFLCHGNIIRSAFAEHLFRRSMAEKNIDDLRISSAGVSCIPGRPADPRAIAVAREFGVDLMDHRAQPVTAETINADVLVIMDYLNQVRLFAEFPGARSKTILLGGCTSQPIESMEIEDPYGGTEQHVRAAYKVIQERISSLADAVAERARVHGQRVGTSS